MKNNKVVLFSGGTGGHVIPAVNFGNYLIDNGYECIIFLDERGIKYSNNFNGRIIKINSAHLTGNFLHILNSLFSLFYGLIQSIYYLSYIRPSSCISFGSYATFTPLIIASIMKIFKITDIYLHEQNSIFGKVNLLFLRFAKYIFINFETLIKKYPKHSNKLFHVGTPYNHKLKLESKENNKKLNKEITIFIYGGSQGSVNLNKLILNTLTKFSDSYIKNLYLIFQSNTNQIDEINSKLIDMKINFEIKDFFNNLNEVLDSCDIVISRSGAGTINDIILSKKPSILIPLPNSYKNHQYLNAKYLTDKHAADLIEEKDFNTQKAYIKLREFIENLDKRNQYINNLQSIEVLDSNKLIFNKIFK